MPGSAWNCRRTSWITLTAALVTAPIASAENQNTSMAPSRPPTNTSGFEMSTEASGEPRAATSSRYAENNRNAASAAEPMAYPLVSALVVLPTASSRSVRRRMSSGWCDISMMPPALSVMGPKVSMARMYAAVPSIPIVATAVPNSPACASPLECTALPTFTISAAIIASYRLGASSGLAHAGLFGTAVATMGMLGTAAYILAMDTFGPITDNAGGIIEMSHQPEAIRKRTDRLDAVGNTTKALTKGYAIGSAALAAFLLFSAYLDEVAALGSPLAAVDISKPEVFVGGLFGAMLVFWFSALAISAVTKAAVSVIQEVRRQFKADPGILKGTSRPDYGRAVDIVTVGALKAMVAPGLLAVGMP